MKIIFCLLFITQLSTFAKTVESTGCNRSDGQCEINQTLSEKFKSIVIKASMVLNDEGFDTLEDFAKFKLPSLNNDYELAFNQYFKAESLTPFMKSIPKANYWKSNSRFDNHASLAVLLMMNFENKNFFSKDELLTLRLLGHTTNQNNLNSFDLSRQVVKLTGGLKGERDISHKEADFLIKSLKNLECEISTDYIEDIYEEVKVKEQELNLEDSKLFLTNDIQIDVPTFSKFKAPLLSVEITDDREDLNIAATYKRVNLRGVSAIHHYHKNYNFDDYVIIDKENSRIITYNEGRIISEKDVVFDLDDRASRGGAGVYYLSDSNELFNENSHYQKTLDEDIELPNNSKVYILPSQKDRRDFHIKNHRIMFNSFEDKTNFKAYNFSLRDTYDIKSDFIISESESAFQKEFIQALEDEKSNLMKIYGMDSDTYNELALFSYAIMGIESKFGKSIKYKIKQTLPYVVSLVKGNGFDTSYNSRGPTQIKKIPVLIKENYGIKKEDLSDPRQAAIATLGFSFEILQDLKRIAHLHKDINSKNIYDYLYYMYQGKRSEIINATATPDKSIRIKMIKDAAKDFQIVDYL